MPGSFLRVGPVVVNLAAPTWFGDSKSAANAVPAMTEADCESIATQLFQRSGAEALSSFDQCGEILWTRLLYALSLNPGWIAGVQAILDQALGSIQQHIHTNVFAVWKTPEELTDGAFLDNAMAKLSPFLPVPPAGELVPYDRDVILCDLGRVRGMTAPVGPILLNKRYFGKDGNTQFQMALAAHEIFHKIQYKLGFRKCALPPDPFAWFSEGTASWAECFATGGQLTSEQKLMAAWSHPELGLRNSSYYAFPFWLQSWKLSPPAGVIKPIMANDVPGRLPPMQPAVAAFAAFHDRVAGSWREYVGATSTIFHGGNGSTVLDPAPHPKLLNIGAGVKIQGWLPEFGGQFFQVQDGTPGAPVPVSVDSGDIIVTPSPATAGQVFGVFARSAGPFVLTIGSPTSGPPVTFPTAVAGLAFKADSWHVALDPLGNVIVTGSSSAVIGYSVNGFSSIGIDSLTEPGQYNSWLEAHRRSTDASGASRQVSIQVRFVSAVRSITRTVKLTGQNDGRPGIVVTTQTENPMESFESILLTGNTGDPGFERDGDSSARCPKNSTDCDGDCRPLWPEQVTVDERKVEVVSTIVPFPGKVILAIPGSGKVVQEIFRFSDLQQ